MMLDVFLSPKAEADIDAHCVYIAENADLETALRFNDAAFASFQRLSQMPFMGSEREYTSSSLHGLRIWFVATFDHYLIFYRVHDDTIQIVRVLHSSRDIESIISDKE